jgi:undecaprenyl-diphosphatase
MTVFQAMVLGLIQGLSELLPISSSAHLALTPWLLDWPDPGLAFDVALHVGTLAAVIWYFRHEWPPLIRSGFAILRHRRITTEHDVRVVAIVLGTIPAAVAGLFLKDRAETLFRDPALIATTLIVMGALLWVVDRYMRADRDLTQMRWREAIFIGVAQMFALVPGVSRSGATITGARLLRFDRRTAAVFSFLLSMPITAAAAVVKVPDAIAEGGLSAALLVGIVSAALSSWLAITVLLRFVSRHSYGVFAIYRIVLGALVFALIALRA